MVEFGGYIELMDYDKEIERTAIFNSDTVKYH